MTQQIAIVHPSSSTRAFLRRHLNEEGVREVVVSSSSSSQLLKSFDLKLPDVLILGCEKEATVCKENLQTCHSKRHDLKVFLLSKDKVDLELKAMVSATILTPSETMDENQAKEIVGQILNRLPPPSSSNAGNRSAQTSSRTATSSPPSMAHQRRRLFDIEAIVIGSSTDGPDALSKLLPELCKVTSLPILIVQHMQKDFTHSLAESLHQECSIPVREAVQGQTVEPRHVYIAPGDYHLTVKRTLTDEIKVHLNQDPPECYCRPSVDVLFRSSAKAWGKRCLALILTGMGSDGTLGLKTLFDSETYILAQDEASSVVWGMLGSAVNAGVVHEVLPLQQLAHRVKLLLSSST